MEMKACKTCNIEQPLQNYWTRKQRGKTYIIPSCPRCQGAKQQASMFARNRKIHERRLANK